MNTVTPVRRSSHHVRAPFYRAGQPWQVRGTAEARCWTPAPGQCWHRPVRGLQPLPLPDDDVDGIAACSQAFARRWAMRRSLWTTVDLGSVGGADCCVLVPESTADREELRRVLEGAGVRD